MSKYNPVIEVSLESGEVEVRLLPLRKAITFLSLLGKVSGLLFASDGKFKLVKRTPAAPAATPSPGGEGRGEVEPSSLVIDTEAIQSAIAQSGELVEFLILHSTGMDEERLGKLNLAEGMAILKAALELNTSQEIQDLGKGIAGVLVGLRKTTPATRS